MIVTLTHADLRAIVNFYADQGVKLAPALIARMSDEQREMAAEIYRRAGEMLIAKADKLADKLADQRDRRAAHG
jgi:pantothenate kinase-related protein Tda10